uniref:Uncharacterized protein n=1 Tax=Kalanchoe fedtschenkoi TaxID=63787 RepID=A0A7N0V985_KALFE
MCIFDRQHRSESTPPPPPPPPPAPFSTSARPVAAKVRRVPEVVEFYHSLMRRDSRRDAGPSGAIEAPASSADILSFFTVAKRAEGVGRKSSDSLPDRGELDGVGRALFSEVSASMAAKPFFKEITVGWSDIRQKAGASVIIFSESDLKPGFDSMEHGLWQGLRTDGLQWKTYDDVVEALARESHQIEVDLANHLPSGLCVGSKSHRRWVDIPSKASYHSVYHIRSMATMLRNTAKDVTVLVGKGRLLASAAMVRTSKQFDELGQVGSGVDAKER